MKRFSLVFLALALLLVPFMYAQDGPEPDEEMGPGMAINGVFRILDELNLTTDQEQKLQTMRESSKRELFALHNDLKTAVWDIQDEFKKNTFDKSKINSLTDKMAEVQKKIIKTRTEHMFKLKEILTPEQFKKLLNLLEKHKKKFDKRMFKENKK